MTTRDDAAPCSSDHGTSTPTKKRKTVVVPPTPHRTAKNSSSCDASTFTPQVKIMKPVVGGGKCHQTFTCKHDGREFILKFPLCECNGNRRSHCELKRCGLEITGNLKLLDLKFAARTFVVGEHSRQDCPPEVQHMVNLVWDDVDTYFKSKGYPTVPYLIIQDVMEPIDTTDKVLMAIDMMKQVDEDLK